MFNFDAKEWTSSYFNRFWIGKKIVKNTTVNIHEGYVQLLKNSPICYDTNSDKVRLCSRADMFEILIILYTLREVKSPKS